MSTVQGGPNIVTDGLVFYVDAANQKSYPGSGTTVNNLTSNQINGTLINGVGFDGKSWTFDGIDDTIDCDSLTPLIENDTQGTIEVWCKVNDSTPLVNNFTFAIGHSTSDTHISLFCTTTGVLRAVGRNNGTGLYNISSDNKVFQDNTYCSVAVVQDGILPKIYFNGELISQSTLNNNNTTIWVNNLTNKDTTRIGSRKSSNQEILNPIEGNISNVKYYNRPLTQTEILQNFNATRARFGV